MDVLGNKEARIWVSMGESHGAGGAPARSSTQAIRCTAPPHLAMEPARRDVPGRSSSPLRRRSDEVHWMVVGPPRTEHAVGSNHSSLPGLEPGIHVFVTASKKDVDGRDIGERKRRRPWDGYARP